MGAFRFRAQEAAFARRARRGRISGRPQVRKTAARGHGACIFGACSAHRPGSVTQCMLLPLLARLRSRPAKPDFIPLRPHVHSADPQL